MSIQKKPESAKDGRSVSPAGSLPAVVPVPKVWLAAFTALLVVPWLGVGIWFLSNRTESPISVETPSPGARSNAARGPWGQLAFEPIVVSPPLESISLDQAPPRPLAWHFPGASLEQLDAFLTSIGAGSDLKLRVLAAARPSTKPPGIVVTPTPELVRSLDPNVRAGLYLRLARSPLNFDQTEDFRFKGDSPGAWLDGSLIAPATRQLVEPLLYRSGGFMHFADFGMLRAQIADNEEVRRLAKTLLRQSTVLMKLTVDKVEEVPGLVEYWGREGRRTDVRPLLESVVGLGSDRSIDAVHLLPAFARDHLYRYPRISAVDFDRPVIANCLWTALNFFKDTPDDRFLDVAYSFDALKKGYQIIEHGFQLGDIVAFVDSEGRMFHAAVYIADDLLFSKNGVSPVAPWTIMSIADVKSYYSSRDPDPRILYHRRNDF